MSFLYNLFYLVWNQLCSAIKVFDWDWIFYCSLFPCSRSSLHLFVWVHFPHFLHRKILCYATGQEYFFDFLEWGQNVIKYDIQVGINFVYCSKIWILKEELWNSQNQRERWCFLFSYSPSRQVFITSHTWSHAVLLVVIAIINLKYDTNPPFHLLALQCNFMTEKDNSGSFQSWLFLNLRKTVNVI